MKHYSKTYPTGWTEEQRVAAENALTKEEIAKLRQEWETPPDFWVAVNKVFDFQVDVCASRHNAKRIDFFNTSMDSLTENCHWINVYDQSLHGNQDIFEQLRAWCNPGFYDVLPWHEKAYAEAQKSPSAVVVVIGIPGASQEWYRFAQTYADEIIDLSPRVHYLAPWPLKQSSNNRESMLFVYRRKVVPTRPATRTLWRWKGEGDEA